MIYPSCFSRLLTKMWNNLSGKTRVAEKDYKKFGTVTKEDMKIITEAKRSIAWYTDCKEGVTKCSLW